MMYLTQHILVYNGNFPYLDVTSQEGDFSQFSRNKIVYPIIMLNYIQKFSFSWHERQTVGSLLQYRSSFFIFESIFLLKRNALHLDLVFSAQVRSLGPKGRTRGIG